MSHSEKKTEGVNAEPVAVDEINDDDYVDSRVWAMEKVAGHLEGTLCVVYKAVYLFVTVLVPRLYDCIFSQRYNEMRPCEFWSRYLKSLQDLNYFSTHPFDFTPQVRREWNPEIRFTSSLVMISTKPT